MSLLLAALLLLGFFGLLSRLLDRAHQPLKKKP